MNFFQASHDVQNFNRQSIVPREMTKNFSWEAKSEWSKEYKEKLNDKIPILWNCKTINSRMLWLLVERTRFIWKIQLWFKSNSINGLDFEFMAKNSREVTQFRDDD